MSRTSDEIVAEMLDNLPEGFNKSTGTVAYDLQKPAAIELAVLEKDQEAILDNAFFDTADDEHKEQIAQDRAGITRKAATYATGTVTITGTVGAEIPEGTLVASDYLEFETTEAAVIGSGGSVTVPIQCTEAGDEGNVPAGAIYEFSVTLDGLNTVTNTEALTGGADIESIEDFSERYHTKIQNPGYSGNPAHYELWAQEVEGVGEAKCFPRTPSVGSVTTYITDRTGRAAGVDLIQETWEHIETQRPCPATSIVAAPGEVPVIVSANLSVTSGAEEDYYGLVKTALNNYIKAIPFKGSGRRVSCAMVGDKILAIEGIADYDNLQLNGMQDSIALADTEIPYFDDFVKGIMSYTVTIIAELDLANLDGALSCIESGKVAERAYLEALRPSGRTRDINYQRIIDAVKSGFTESPEYLLTPLRLTCDHGDETDNFIDGQGDDGFTVQATSLALYETKMTIFWACSLTVGESESFTLPAGYTYSSTEGREGVIGLTITGQTITITAQSTGIVYLNFDAPAGADTFVVTVMVSNS